MPFSKWNNLSECWFCTGSHSCFCVRCYRNTDPYILPFIYTYTYLCVYIYIYIYINVYMCVPKCSVRGHPHYLPPPWVSSLPFGMVWARWQTPSFSSLDTQWQLAMLTDADEYGSSKHAADMNAVTTTDGQHATNSLLNEWKIKLLSRRLKNNPHLPQTGWGNNRLTSLHTLTTIYQMAAYQQIDCRIIPGPTTHTGGGEEKTCPTKKMVGLES